MAEGVYSNGLPHPPPGVRVRMALELAVIALLTVAFLGLVPSRAKNSETFFGMALIGLGLVAAGARYTREKIWGPPESPPFDRIRRCATTMTALTLPPVLVFFAYGWYVGGAERMHNPNFFIVLPMYLMWALLQQTLFQFYLLGRLRALLPFASPLLLSVINGIAYGLVHLPNVQLTVVTCIGGIFWSYSYHRDRYVLPIAISHALLAATFFYWVNGHDLWAEFLSHMH